MKKINIREALLKLDRDSCCRYDLTSLYEACRLDDEDKCQLVKYIDAYEHPSVIGGFLEAKCKDVTENYGDDDVADIKGAEDVIKEINDQEVSLFMDYDIDDEEHPLNSKEPLVENVVVDDADEARKYVWKKILPFDNLTDDYSDYWDFDQDIRDGLAAVIVSDEVDIPDSANYKYSFIEAGLNVYFVDNPEYKYYILDKNYIKEESLEEAKESKECPICHRKFVSNEVDFNADRVECPKCTSTLIKLDSGEYELLDDDHDIDELGEAYRDREEYNPEDGWTEEDIALHKSIDWKARNYEPYVDEHDTFRGEVVAYGLPGGPRKAEVMFAKEFSANPIYSPSYKPTSNPFEGTVGFMYDGTKHNGYMVMDRTETQEVYDMMFEDVDAGVEKVATKSNGDYLIQADSGKGYTAFNKHDVCIGGIDTDDEAEAKNKFMSNKLDEGVWDDIKSVSKAIGNEVKNSKTYQKHIQPKVNKVKSTVDKVKNSDAAKNITQAVKDTDTYKNIKSAWNAADIQNLVKSAKNKDDVQKAADIYKWYSDENKVTNAKDKENIDKLFQDKRAQFGITNEELTEESNDLEKYSMVKPDVKYKSSIGGKEVSYSSYDDAKSNMKNDFKMSDYNDELRAYLTDKKLYNDMWVDPDGRLAIAVKDGDWKHDHHYLDEVVREFFFDKGLFVDIEEEVTDEDGSDVFSSNHYYDFSDIIFTQTPIEEDADDLKFVDNRQQSILSGDPIDDPGFDEYDLDEGCSSNLSEADNSEWFVGNSEDGRMYKGKENAQKAYNELVASGCEDAVMQPAEDISK